VTTTLAPFAQDPTELAILGESDDPIVRLRFHEDKRVQKCSECWFDWFDSHLCTAAPCNSQGRTDGKMRTWQEEGRHA